MLDDFTRASDRILVRGELARAYAVGSLLYTARHELDLPHLTPRALGWYARLLELGVAVPLGVVLDLGWLLLDGDNFRLRRLRDLGADAAERRIREAYESTFLTQRLAEANYRRLRRLLLDHADADRALVRVLELLLRPLAERLTVRLGAEPPQGLAADLKELDPVTARDSFELGVGRPGLLLRLLAELAAQGAELDLDRTLADEDFYELRHIRVFPRESLREVARRIGRVERLLGPPRGATARVRRERALAETALEAVGTYPTGGIAELSTSGPIENLVPSELIYLEPDQPIDPFLVRFAENELLRWLRDSAVLHLMRRTVIFLIEDATPFGTPLGAVGELRGTKIIRCLMGLVLRLTADLLTVFRRDDLSVDLRLVTAAEESAESRAARREILEVLHLLLREKEEQGTASIQGVTRSIGECLEGLPSEARRQVTVVVLGRWPTIEPLLRHKPSGARLVPVAVNPPAELPDGVVPLRLEPDPLLALRTAREAVLERMVG